MTPSSLLVWRGRNAELETAHRIFIPTYAAILRNAGFMISQQLDITNAPQLLPDLVSLHLSIPLMKAHTALFNDVAERFVRRRGSAIKSADAVESIPMLHDWVHTTIHHRINGIARATQKGILALTNAVDQRPQKYPRGLSTTLRTHRVLFGPLRARAILQTEINSTANAATHYSIVLDFPPQSLNKQWLSVGDLVVRDTHAHRDASEQRGIPYDQPFEIGTSKMQFPGDSLLGAPVDEIAGCRCIAHYSRK